MFAIVVLDVQLIILSESAIAKQLIDKIYEKRKSAALDLEKWVYPTWNPYSLELSPGRYENATSKEMNGG